MYTIQSSLLISVSLNCADLSKNDESQYLKDFVYIESKLFSNQCTTKVSFQPTHFR
jgi:hypothetical protein